LWTGKYEKPEMPLSRKIFGKIDNLYFRHNDVFPVTPTGKQYFNEYYNFRKANN